MSQIYQSLMVLAHPAADSFDAHVLACVLAVSQMQSCELGLENTELSRLTGHYFPLAVLPPQQPPVAEAPEEQDLCALLLSHATDSTNQTTRWLGRIIARRSQSANHLWQDLGLTGRADLSACMRRHFAPLVAMNNRDMKWKKFFYRQLCQMEGLTLCKSPVCDECEDFNTCFAPEE